MLIDTHCHLDALEFAEDRHTVVKLAERLGIKTIVVPAVTRASFDDVISLASQYAICRYALGIHPMVVESAQVSDLDALNDYLAKYSPIAVGEIGLDYFAKKPLEFPLNAKLQTHYFSEQLNMAKAHHLPVILHVRGAIDDVLKHLRRIQVVGGIAHAFNGSLQQAEQFIALGFKLGFGGAMTYSRAKHIRMLAQKLPLDSIVLETDAPDIPPEWVGGSGRNSPVELPKIAQILAEIRGLNVAQVLDITSANAIKVLPKLADLCT